MFTAREIAKRIETTPFVDTHEHLMEESERVDSWASPGPDKPLADFAVLFAHYAASDLAAAGMAQADHDRLFGHDANPAEKWRLFAPVYERTRHTGYLRCVRESLRLLFGERDIHEGNYASLTERLAEMSKPGYYRHVLKDVANIEYCQVNALEETVFRETAQPSLLAQDISTVALATGLDVPKVSDLAKRTVTSLADWHAVIDWCFATYGPRAVATKNQSAYGRRLDYAEVSADEAAPLFERYLADPESLKSEERKAIQDHLFHYCLDKATEYSLPVKLHTGYYAGHRHMPLERVRQNAADLCPILQAHPETKFVLMHIDYPYQDEAIALAKHYPNAYIDMCWAWIINPAAGVRFVKEFLMAAPSNKLLTFGGDYSLVEVVTGHAAMARQGLTQAITELVDEGWLEPKHVPDLIDRLMRGNAHDLFDYEGTLAQWGIPASEAEDRVADTAVPK